MSTLRLMLASLLALMLCTSGCMTPPTPTVEDSSDLNTALQLFHKHLRWANYESAAALVAPTWRNVFLGRYEEYGEDFHMVMLEVLKVEMVAGESAMTPQARVEVEQQWYREPNMTVKKERFVEEWQRSRNGWMLTQRTEKQEWKERQKAEDEAKIKDRSIHQKGRASP